MGTPEHLTPDELRTLANDIEYNTCMRDWESDKPTHCMVPREITRRMVEALYDVANQLDDRTV
jgi:hypothetical protein